MDRGRRRCFGRALLGCALLLTIVGCCYPRPRHGLIVRGDWSLELNRVPWLISRAESVQGCSVQSDGCPVECVRDGAVPGEVRGQGPGATGPGGSCAWCGRLRGSGESTAEGYTHPRFHPVPTRPVFQPPTEGYPSVARPEKQQASGTGDAGRDQIDPSLEPPALKLILAPEPDPPEEAGRTKPASDEDGASGSSRATAPP